MGIDPIVPCRPIKLEVVSRRVAGQALIDQMDAEAEAALELAREAVDAFAPRLLAVVHIEGQSDHGGLRLPLADDRLEPLPIGTLSLGAHGFQRRGRAGHCLADRHADLARAEVEAE